MPWSSVAVSSSVVVLSIVVVWVVCCESVSLLLSLLLLSPYPFLNCIRCSFFIVFHIPSVAVYVTQIFVSIIPIPLLFLFSSLISLSSALRGLFLFLSPSNFILFVFAVFRSRSFIYMLLCLDRFLLCRSDSLHTRRMLHKIVFLRPARI